MQKRIDRERACERSSQVVFYHQADSWSQNIERVTATMRRVSSFARAMGSKE